MSVNSLQTKLSAAQIINEFCGPPAGNANGGQKPVTGQEVITQLAIDEIRSRKPLFDTLTPLLPEPLQHLIASYLYFFADKECSIEALSIRTGSAFLRHMQAVASVHQQFSTKMSIRFNCWELPGDYTLANPQNLFDLVNLDPRSYRWEIQHELWLTSCSHNDEQLERLLTHFNNVEDLTLSGCPNLYSLQGLSCLPNLKRLKLNWLEQLQNSSWRSHIPLEQLDLTDAKPGIPCFDLAALKLSKLEELTIRIKPNLGNELRVIDAKNCKRLKKLTVEYDKNFGNVRFARKIIDVRGLNCKVILIPQTIWFKNDEETPREWTKVLKD